LKKAKTVVSCAAKKISRFLEAFLRFLNANILIIIMYKCAVNYLFLFKHEIMAKPEEKKTIKKMGRPKMQEARIPFTTSLISSNKGKLEVLSSVRGQRKADVLNEILAYYFENATNTKEKELLDAL